MRTAFIEALTELAAADPRVTLVVGDLGFGVVEPFAARFPAQYLNAGVAEQNMTGLAAGLALAGRVVFTYSIANFPTIRCLEQIRNDVCYHNLPVKIVAVGGGLAYGSLGMTHHATEDMAIMRALPRMTVVAPGDPIQARAATLAVGRDPGPCYLRLGRAGEDRLLPVDTPFALGVATRVRPAGDATIVSTGGMLQTAIEAADLLAQEGVTAGVLAVHTLKPLDEEAVREHARASDALVTLEEHSIIGGLGGAVAEVLMETPGLAVRFKRLGLPSAFSSEAGTQEYLRGRFGLTAGSVAAQVRALLKPVAPP